MRRDGLIDGCEGNSVGKEVSVTTMSESQKMTIRQLIVLALIVACVMCTVSLVVLANCVNRMSSIKATDKDFMDVTKVQFAEKVTFMDKTQSVYTRYTDNVSKIKVAFKNSVVYVRLYYISSLPNPYCEYVVNAASVIVYLK